MSMTAKNSADESPFISPAELALRWRCGRSSVDRITRKGGLSRLCLGDGKNAMVRFLKKEVIAYEASRCIVMQ
jgi:hypothetical protein